MTPADLSWLAARGHVTLTELSRVQILPGQLPVVAQCCRIGSHGPSHWATLSELAAVIFPDPVCIRCGATFDHGCNSPFCSEACELREAGNG